MAAENSILTDLPAPGGTHAVVIGGGIAGLFAGRALARHFDRVTVIERDRLADGAGPRKGAPQARHVHVLLTRGQAILDQFFPGAANELAAAGAPALDWGADTAWFGKYGWGQRFEIGLTGRTFSRDLLEGLLRQRLAADARLRFMSGYEVTGLVTEPGRKAVTGVLVRPRDPAVRTGEPVETIPAELVVDASGRGSRALQWLQALGYVSPEETTINAYLGYATRWYAIPARRPVDWKLLIVRAEPPAQTRGGVIMQVEGDRWVVTLSGVGRDYPPTDEAGFLEFARSLPTPALFEAIQEAEPLTPVYGYQRNENRLRHYERLVAWPDGFAVLGDAACAFNPVYGQGMSTAALGALALDECLRALPAGADLVGLGKRFQKRLAKVNRIPWLMATGVDYRWPATVASRPARSNRFMHWYMDQIVQLAFTDRQALQAFLRVAHLIRPPVTFFRPGLAVKAMAQALRSNQSALPATGPGQTFTPATNPGE